MSELPTSYEPLLLTFHEPRLIDHAIVVGSDDGTRFVLVSDAVFSVDPNGRLPRRFVNSSIAAFASCIEAHREYCDAVTDACSEAEELRVAERLAVVLAKIDSAALADPENWWSVVVEQVRDGLL
jgi:hypothetical protein